MFICQPSYDSVAAWFTTEILCSHAILHLIHIYIPCAEVN